MDCLVFCQAGLHPLPPTTLAISSLQGVEIAKSVIRTMPTRPGRLGPQAGFSLMEMLIAITVAGLMLALALPRIRDTLVTRDARSARAVLANMYARARVNALQTRRSSTIHFSGNEVWVTAPLGAGLDTVGAVVNLTTIYGVAINASVGTITVLPTGLSNMAAVATIKVSRGGKADSVMISGYGRLQ